MRHRLHLLLALLAVTACGQTATVVSVEVASVVVTPSAASVEVGLTVQFQASALDASGTTVSGQPVTWESTLTGVATISAQGVATGVSAGSTEIRATVGGVTASQTLTVTASGCTSRADVTLAPGQHVSFAGSQCLLLPAGAAGDVYRVAIARPTLIADTLDTPTVTLDISPVLVAAAAVRTAAADPAPSAQTLPLIDGTRALEHLRIQDATRQFHNELRMRERALGLDPALARPNLSGPLAAPLAQVDPPATRDMFLDLTCSATATRKATQLIAFNDNLAIYQESAEWASNPITVADAALMFAYYDSYVKDMIQAYWGAIPDTDGNSRIIVVTSPSLAATTAAAVYSGDFFPAVGPGSCAGSNEGEVIYFSGDLIAALDDASPDPFALGVLAHEAKHVISLYNSIQRPSGFNDLWIEEGTAEISSVMSSRLAWAATGGPSLGAPITRTDIVLAAQANGGVPTDEMSSLVDALAGVVRSLSAQPNSVITDPAGAPSGHSFYANSWHWHRFLGDAFGGATTPQADSTFFRALTASSTTAGGASGEIFLTGRSFDQLFEDFVVAVSLQGTGFSPTYEITTWDFLSAADVFSNPNPAGSYPWPVTADDTNSWDPFVTASYTGTMGPSGVRFHDFRSSGSAGAQISVTGADAGRIIVTRID